MVLDVLRVCVRVCKEGREREERRQRLSLGMGAVEFLFRVPKSKHFFALFQTVVTHRIERWGKPIVESGCIAVCLCAWEERDRNRHALVLRHPSGVFLCACARARAGAHHVFCVLAMSFIRACRVLKWLTASVKSVRTISISGSNHDYFFLPLLPFFFAPRHTHTHTRTTISLSSAALPRDEKLSTRTSM